jgi:hypothetical protein
LQAAELAARAASATQAAASTAEIGKSSEFSGVSWRAQARKWHAYGWRGGTMHHIANCDVEADAAKAVDDWLLQHGKDRVNFDAENNRIVQQSTDASIYRGVTWHKRDGKWMAQIYVSTTAEYLGRFDTQKEAAEAYDERAWKLGKPTNFTFDGERNELKRGKVKPQVRTETWTAALEAERAARIAAPWDF